MTAGNHDWSYCEICKGVMHHCGYDDVYEPQEALSLGLCNPDGSVEIVAAN